MLKDNKMILFVKNDSNHLYLFIKLKAKGKDIFR